MDSIEAIIASSSNETRKTVAISLGAASDLTNINEGYACYLCRIKDTSNDRGTTTLSTWYSCPMSSRKRLQQWQRQLIATRVQNRTTTAISPLMCTTQINDLKGARRQRCNWSWRLDKNVDNVTIISYCHIVMSDDNNRWMRGKIKQTPTKQWKFHVVVCKMPRWPYRAMQGSAAQIRQGQVWQVRQRRLHPSRRAKTGLSLKKAATNPLSRMATGWVQWWAPYHKGNWPRMSCEAATSILLWDWVTVYIVPSDNEPY